MASCFISSLNKTMFLLTVGLVMLTEGFDRKGNFYRIEVNFTRFENPDGTVRSGSYCDLLSKCDPHIYAFVDIVDPLVPFPGMNLMRANFTLVHGMPGKNVYDITEKNKIIKTICEVGQEATRLPTFVNVRVEVYDKDLYSPNDLIEQFDCVFPFSVVLRTTDPLQAGVRECSGVNRKGKVKLFFRSQIYKIFSTECYMPF